MLKYSIDQGLFNEQEWLKELQVNLGAFRDAAARVFIRATFSRVPTWSGASRASLVPLSQLVNEAKHGGFLQPLGNLQQFIKPKAFSPRDFPSDDKHHGIDSGRRRGEQSRIFNKDQQAGFLFVTSVFQYWLLEEDWDSIPFGDSALQGFIARRFGEVFPEWHRHLRITTRILD